MRDYNKLFSLFTCKDTGNNRPYYKQPFKQDGMYYATDGHVLIFMPSEICQLDYRDQDKPACKGVIPIEGESVPINISLLEAEINAKTPLVDEFLIKERECSNCYGEGEVECDMGHDHDCPDCDGSGIIEGKNPTGNKVKDEKSILTIFGSFFSYIQIERLINASKELNEPVIYKIAGEGQRVFLFKVGECKILICPCVSSLEYEINIEIKN
jgi:hypothetical protein